MRAPFEVNFYYAVSATAVVVLTPWWLWALVTSAPMWWKISIVLLVAHAIYRYAGHVRRHFGER